MKEQPTLMRSVRFGQSTCFLCSAPLRNRNRSEEHVFPKWLQNRFNLWNQRMVLTNLTEIPYRQLTIPCCKTCNNVHLSKVEDIMRAAIESGPYTVTKLPPPIVYMWLSKIFYGILYRENLLRADRRIGKRPIIPQKALRQLRLHHDFMQGIRRPIEFPFGVPGSIFVFGTTKPDRVEAQFDFLDNHHNRSIALRMGSVGIVCCLQDGGQTRQLHDQLKRPYYRKNRLHPVQFREITAEIFYKSMLLESVPLYTVLEDVNKLAVLTQNPPSPRFGDWNFSHFCQILAHHWGQPLEEIYNGTGRATSILDDQERFQKLDPNALYTFSVPNKLRQAQIFLETS